jgi:hypothetical protein
MYHDSRFGPERSLAAEMKKRFIGLAAVYVLIPAMLLAQPVGKKPLVGVWAVKVSPVGQSQSPLLSLAMFGGDGSFTTGVGYKALPAIPVIQDFAAELGPGYGRWAATGDREFRLTFYSVMWKAAVGTGFQRVQDTLVLSESGDEYTGRAQVDFLDADWNVVFSTTSEEKGSRLEAPVSSTPVGEPAGKKPLVGVWEVKVSSTGQWQSPLLSLAMYGGDGSFNTTGGYKALPSISAVQNVATEISAGYGRWAATGAKEFRLTYYSVLWKAGLVNGFQRVQDTLVLTESGDEYAGRAQVDFMDANWNVVFSTTSDVKGTRLETPIPATLAAQPAERKGAWEIKGSRGAGRQSEPPILGLILSREDGTWSEDRGRQGINSPATKRVADEFNSPGYGRLMKTGDREYRLVFYYAFLKAGLVNGFLRIQSNEVSPESGDEFTGQANWAEFDSNWNVLTSGTGGGTGTRLETPGQD